MKPKLIMMIGLQASGKSTKAQELSKIYKAVVLSSDECRKLYPKFDNNKIFKVIHETTNRCLSQGINVILDSTNTTLKMRRHALQAIKVGCEKIAYVMNTPYEDCVKRLEQRNKQYMESHGDVVTMWKQGYVPLEALDKYHKSFQIPFIEEGFQEIQFDREIPYSENTKNWAGIEPKMDLFDQKNIHHTETLGKHIKTVSSRLFELQKDNITPEIRAMINCPHDIGKLFTQTFSEDDQAHYYNHAEIGAYYYITHLGCYDMAANKSEWQYDLKGTLLNAFYINYHMLPFNWQTNKAKTKWKSIFGEEKFNNLITFNKCDSGDILDD